MKYTGPNYGLEDGVPARGEDEGSDADDDFVNNDVASDGENSDEGSASQILPEEVENAATVQAPNSRKLQGKTAKKGTTPQKTPKVSASEKEAKKSRSKTINSVPQHQSQSSATPRKPKITNPSTVLKQQKGSAMYPIEITDPEPQVANQPKTPKLSSFPVDLSQCQPQSLPLPVTSMAIPSQDKVMPLGDQASMNHSSTAVTSRLAVTSLTAPPIDLSIGTHHPIPQPQPHMVPPSQDHQKHNNELEVDQDQPMEV